MKYGVKKSREHGAKKKLIYGAEKMYREQEKNSLESNPKFLEGEGRLQKKFNEQ